MLLGLASQPQLFVVIVIAFVVAITIHEASHALVASRLGDDLPRIQGRVTLNPMRHLDPLGTIMIAIASFGWGRPVMVNPYRLRFGVHQGMALVAAAGPASNILLAAALTPIARELIANATPDSLFLAQAVVLILQLNIFLAVFNLIPIPPLDGFSVLVGLVPQETAGRLNELRRFGPMALMGVFLLFAVVPGVGGIISGPALWVVDLLLG